ncbi:DsbA family protein [Staphylococcus xylosus]|uniref:DsbA family protein n=1 Tax=Staphylococcus xylosus TaxID=1288 RepID=UPI000D1D195A|nr:thioredoxin domain-containing protein [Staphylococcus xylosus]MCE7785630.1 DsbA family protein [Staphylococcus xylosus]PTI02247.1 protein-disulfide isomerase [Staphylococcus xylosus]
MKNKLICVIVILILSLIGGSLYFFQKVGWNDVNKKDLSHDTSYAPSLGNSKSSNLIVEFMDFKCPYCKKFESKTLREIQNHYNTNNDLDYKIINVSLLGKDSILVSRAAHAVNLYYPDKYWDFHKKIINLQPNHENKWITYKLIDKELNKLNIPQKQLNLIKHDYKTKNSKSWKLANKDNKLFKKYENTQVPSIYVNGKFIKDPYNPENIIKELK